MKTKNRLHILVTAGPTREMLDPVRFLSNVSTGEMGYAIAREARRRGFGVTLVSGPVHLKPPRGVRFIPVVSARDMEIAVKREFPRSDALVMTAAVCDYMPLRRERQKMRRITHKRVIFKQTHDILKAVTARKRKHQFVVGFCLETENLERNAIRKLREKRLDLIVANLYNRANHPFGRNRLSVTLVGRDLKRRRVGKRSKAQVARLLVSLIREKRAAQSS